MSIEIISPNDTHVIHVGISVDTPDKLIFCIEDARTREPIACVKLTPDGAKAMADSIPKLIEEMRQKGL